MTTATELIPNTDEMKVIVFRTKYVGGSRRQSVYHYSIECSRLNQAARILKNKVGSMIAGGFSPCQLCTKSK